MRIKIGDNVEGRYFGVVENIEIVDCGESGGGQTVEEAEMKDNCIIVDVKGEDGMKHFMYGDQITAVNGQPVTEEESRDKLETKGIKDIL